MIIFWIDPGTTTVWYAILEKQWNNTHLLDYGVISTPPKVSFLDKALEIIKDLEFLIEKYPPDRVVIEKIFFANNQKTVIDVAQMRWVILQTFLQKWAEILEYTPLEMKKAITGNGKASKKQIQNAIWMFFWLDEPPKPDDAADAIGLGYMWALKRFDFL